MIRNPTSNEDEIRDTVWLIGLVQEGNTNVLRLEVIPDRTIETLTSFFQRNIIPVSIIKSDGYPSYPRAIANAECEHRIVNHSMGFVNNEGEHTNNIENVWSHLKTEIRSRRGVMLANMSDFAKEFVIFKKNNAIRSRTNTSNFFKKILMSLSHSN